MLRIYTLSPYGYYLYVGIGWSWNTWDGRLPDTSSWTIAIPIKPGGRKEILFTDQQCSTLLQGRSRSKTGMTDVTHIKVSGDLEIVLPPGRSAESKKLRRTEPRGAADRTSTWIRYPVVGGYPTDRFCPETVGMIRLMRYRTDGWWTSHLEQRGRVWTQIIGTTDSGKYVHVQPRTWARDQMTFTIEWNLDRAAGKFTLHTACDYDGAYHMIDTVNVAPSGSRLSKTSAHGHWEQTQVFSLSDAAVWSFAHPNENPKWSSSDFQGFDFRSEGEYYYYLDGKKTYFDPGYSIDVGTMMFGPAPDSVDYTALDDVSLNLEPLLRKFESLESYQIGYQNCSGQNYAFGTHSGKDRGGTTIYAELQDRAIEDNRYINTNLPMFFRDLSHCYEDWNNLSDQLKTDRRLLRKVFKAVRKKNQSGSTSKLAKDVAQGAANTYLPIKYGWRLTQSEAIQIGEGIARIWDDVRGFYSARYLGPERAQERLRETSDFDLLVGDQVFCWQATVLPDRNLFSGLFAFLDERSLWLTAEDIWDYVPYSFVVNWFCDLPKRVVNYADRSFWQMNYNLEEACRSYKFTGYIDAREVINLPSFELAPELVCEISYYHRGWNTQFDPPLYYKGEDFDPSVPLSHWTEITALVIQRL